MYSSILSFNCVSNNLKTHDGSCNQTAAVFYPSNKDWYVRILIHQDSSKVPPCLILATTNKKSSHTKNKWDRDRLHNFYFLTLWITQVSWGYVSLDSSHIFLGNKSIWFFWHVLCTKYKHKINVAPKKRRRNKPLLQLDYELPSCEFFVTVV